MTEAWARPDVKLIHDVLLENVKLVYHASHQDTGQMLYLLKKLRTNLASLEPVFDDVISKLEATGIKSR